LPLAAQLTDQFSGGVDNMRRACRGGHSGPGQAARARPRPPHARTPL